MPIQSPDDVDNLVFCRFFVGEIDHEFFVTNRVEPDNLILLFHTDNVHQVYHNQLILVIVMAN